MAGIWLPPALSDVSEIVAPMLRYGVRPAPANQVVRRSRFTKNACPPMSFSVPCATTATPTLRLFSSSPKIACTAPFTVAPKGPPTPKPACGTPR